ncbi:MAG TPA: hypothetical protein VK919_12620, partial [Solirubrobacterales bacterium]|nr:hypothetical protein [Solirubrobacterales bacterium]
LAAIVGAGAETLRRAGEAVEPPPAGAGPGAVFARRGSLEGADEGAETEEAAAARAAPEPGPGERDEVDELFTGG